VGRMVLLWGYTNPKKFLDFNHRGGSRCPHRDCQTAISRRDGAIHLARSPEPFRDWYHCEFRSETVGLYQTRKVFRLFVIIGRVGWLSRPHARIRKAAVRWASGPYQLGHFVKSKIFWELVLFCGAPLARAVDLHPDLARRIFLRLDRAGSVQRLHPHNCRLGRCANLARGRSG